MNRELLQQARDALQTLHDEQNDAPLEQRRAQWEAAMRRAISVITVINAFLDAALAAPAPAQPAEPCPNAARMGEYACTNRHQCWEPCGELGHSMEHAVAYRGSTEKARSAQPDEREAFEARFSKPEAVTWNGSEYEVLEGWENSYRIDRFLGQWEAWQARALLAQEPAQPADLTDDQIADLWGRYPALRKWMKDRLATPAPVAQPAILGWAHEDGRVIPASTKATAERDGGASASAVRDYTIPLGKLVVFIRAHEDHEDRIEALEREVAELRRNAGVTPTDGGRR